MQNATPARLGASGGGSGTFATTGGDLIITLNVGAGSFQSSPSSSGTVPEPSSLILSGLGLVSAALVARPRRRRNVA